MKTDNLFYKLFQIE
ncbi:hypothetical protein GlitD10_0345, partial [Gloeomargarita lithophora Alchichica-D10]